MPKLQELISWMVGHITPVIGFLGVLGGLVLAIVFVINIIFPCIFSRSDVCNQKPVFESVIPTELSPQQVINVSGENLYSLQDVQLRKGLVTEPLFIMLLSETGMLLAVPSDVGEAN